MNLYIYEARKLWTQKPILAMLGVLLLWGGFAFWTGMQKNTEIETLETHKQILVHIREMDIRTAIAELEEYQQNELSPVSNLRLARLIEDEGWEESLLLQYPELLDGNWSPRFSSEEWIDATVITQLLPDLYYLRDYETGIDTIHRQSEQMLQSELFNTTGFSRNNILKTAKDFKYLYNLPLKADINIGVTQATASSGLTDIILLAMVILLTIGVIASDREEGLFRVLRSTEKGRGPLLGAKLLLLLSCSGVTALLLYGSNMVMADVQFGFGDMSRYVQSIPAFGTMEMVLTVAEYLTVYMLGKILMAVCISTVIFMLMVHFRNAMTAYVVVAFWLGTSYILYRFIPGNAFFNHPKYLNVFAFLDTDSLLRKYLNLNIFSLAVGYRMLVLILAFSLSIAAGLIAYKAFRSKKELTGSVLLLKLRQKLILRFARERHSVNPFVHECYKLFVGRKAALLLMVLPVVLLWNQGEYNPAIRDPEEQLFVQTIAQNGGFLTGAPTTYMETALQDGTSISALFAERYNALSEGMEMTGIEPMLVNDRAYVVLFGTVSDMYTRRYFGYDNMLLILLLFVILGCAGSFCTENRQKAKKLLLSTPYGRGAMVYRKLCACTLYALPCFLLSKGLHLFNIFDSFGSKFEKLPIQSVRGFEQFPWALTTVSTLIIQVVAELLLVLAVVVATAVISEISRHPMTASLLSAVVFVLPVALILFRIEIAQFFSLYLPFVLSPLLISSYRVVFLVILLLGALLTIAFSSVFLLRRYRAMRKKGI